MIQENKVEATAILELIQVTSHCFWYALLMRNELQDQPTVKDMNFTRWRSWGTTSVSAEPMGYWGVW